MTDTEEKKAFLEMYETCSKRIKRIEREIEELREMKMSVSVRYDDMPKGHNVSDLSDYVAKLDTLEWRLLKEKTKKIEILESIENAIEKMNDENEKDLLYYKYIDGLKWWKIGEIMHYTERHVMRLHGTALLHFRIPE